MYSTNASSESLKVSFQHHCKQGDSVRPWIDAYVGYQARVRVFQTPHLSRESKSNQDLTSSLVLIPGHFSLHFHFSNFLKRQPVEIHGCFPLVLLIAD